MTDEVWKVEDVAAYLGVPKKTIYNKVAQGTIPHVRIGERTIRFRKSAIEQWLAEAER